MFLGLQVTVFRFDPGTIQPLITRRIPNFPSIVFTVYTVRLEFQDGCIFQQVDTLVVNPCNYFLKLADTLIVPGRGSSRKDGTPSKMRFRAPARLCKLSFRGNARTALQRSAAWARNASCSSNPSSQRPASHCSGHCRPQQHRQQTQIGFEASPIGITSRQ